ncbi:MAG: putative short-subunit dehydrogenase-like oxidoreductase (DUF2520 family) [Arenicella sp.]|jgi:predicted short-subunit dehydrogenase-like oxidoreductase (DUF2520 family)
MVIIGRGKVGQSLSQLFTLLDYQVDNVGRNRSKQVAAVIEADITVICVDDGSIEGVCEALASSFKKGSIVCHCSGALDSSILKSARQRDCLVASCHPLNTFPSISLSLQRFASTSHNSYMYCEGDAAALSVLLPLFERTGFNNMCIQRQAKPLYHAACVFASNYLISLMDMSLEAASKAGLEKQSFWLSLQPLIQSTIENITANGTAGALSGPIARGDHATVKSHTLALDEHSDSLKLSYAELGMRALEIAIESGQLSADDIERLRSALDTRTKG